MLSLQSRMYALFDMRIWHRNRLERWPGELPEGFLKFTLIFAIITGPGLCILGIWMLITMVEGALWAFAMGAVLTAYGVMSVQVALAQFTFSAQGISVKYPLESPREYSWGDFQQICICYPSRGTEVRNYPILCLVKAGEKKDSFGRWKTLSVFRYRNILCLDHSEALLEAVRKYCPYEIPDLRNQGNYRI